MERMNDTEHQDTGSGDAVARPFKQPVRRGFWQGFWDGLALKPLWARVACSLGWHSWWHMDIHTKDGRYALCCDCGNIRKVCEEDA